MLIAPLKENLLMENYMDLLEDLQLKVLKNLAKHLWNRYLYGRISYYKKFQKNVQITNVFQNYIEGMNLGLEPNLDKATIRRWSVLLQVNEVRKSNGFQSCFG